MRFGKGPAVPYPHTSPSSISLSPTAIFRQTHARRQDHRRWLTLFFGRCLPQHDRITPILPIRRTLTARGSRRATAPSADMGCLESPRYRGDFETVWADEPVSKSQCLGVGGRPWRPYQPPFTASPRGVCLQKVHGGCYPPPGGV